MTREQRRKDLEKMWRDKHGRAVVLGLFHRALPDGEAPQPGMSIFEVILDQEFGPPRGNGDEANQA